LIPVSGPVDCVILGSGGHAAVVIDALRSSRPGLRLAVLDPDGSRWGASILGVPIVGGDDRLTELMERGVSGFVVGLGGTGDNLPRKALFEKGTALGVRAETVIHATAVFSSWAGIEGGSVILPGAVVNARASLGVNVIVNSGSIVEHDCSAEDHVHIATGARLAASVRVGACAHVGVGAVIRQGVSIGERAVVGAGAVVVRDVPAGETVVGNPAKPLGRSRAGARAGSEGPLS
jgi:sugar O-acyltransferase (sialic acid O-acetyltransferase NeuD family)